MDQTSHLAVPATLAAHERRAWTVAGVNLCAMAVLVTGAITLRSAAVLAEGVHTGAHVGAMLVAGLAYRIAARVRVRSSDAARRIGDAAGLLNALLLLVLAAGLALESLDDLRRTQPLNIGEALALAGLGLGVNLVSLRLLHHAHGHEPGHERDLSFRALYLHMIGDAAVGLMSVAGLILAGACGWGWADGAAGLVGAALIAGLAVQIMRAVFAAQSAPGLRRLGRVAPESGMG